MSQQYLSDTDKRVDAMSTNNLHFYRSQDL